jgi:TolA-binding protein
LKLIAKINFSSEDILFYSSILTTLTIQKPELKSNEDFFQRGLELYRDKNFKRAKFYFAFAFTNDPKAPQYSFYLGKVFFAQKLWEAAKINFKNTRNIDPNYPGVDNLLKEVEEKEKKGQVYCYDSKTDSYISYEPT